MNKTENNLIPELRFPEFKGEWKIKDLGNLIISLDAGVSVNSTNRVAKKYEMAILKTSCVFTGVFDISQNKAVIEEKEITRLREPVTSNTIIISRMNTPTLVGANAFVNQSNANVFLPDRLWAAKIHNTANPFWVSILLSSQKLRLALSNRATGTSNSMKNITKSDVLTLPINIPPLSEQTKIANFLTAIDKRINLLQKKKAELEQYKNGVMQKLFSQTIRFKKNDGSDFPDWEEKKLGSLGNTYNGLTGKTKVDFGKGKPYIQYMQIFSSSRIDTANFGFVNIEENENQNYAKYGDVFFTTSSETPNEIGTSSVLTEDIEEVYLNSFCFGYRPNSLDELVPEFSQFFFRSNNVRKEIIKLAQGSTRFNMSKVELMKLKFDFPKKEEQIKIANFLSSIDKSIEKLGNQIDESVVFKKGLLQKMFV